MINEISSTAIKYGAQYSKIISVKQVEVGEWVYWKCRYGCSLYGKCFTCPPYSPNPKQMRAILMGYEYALLVRYDLTQDYHTLLLKLEREAFFGGLYKAFGLTAGSCRLCDTCNVIEGNCTNPTKARPSMEACGIDVFRTACNSGLDMKVLTSKGVNYPRICLLLLQ